MATRTIVLSVALVFILVFAGLTIEALFRRGTAVLVPRPRGAMPDTLLTGRLGGAAVQ